MDEQLMKAYCDLLAAELVPATGCTEPIAVAYAAALAKKTLGTLPERVEISVSGNILKNVKSVIVPNTGGLRGVAAAAAAGIVAGHAEKKLEVLAHVTPKKYAAIAEYLEKTPISVEKSTSGCVFDIGIRVFAGTESAFVRIEGRHTNVVRIERNGEKTSRGRSYHEKEHLPELTIDQILEFCTQVPPETLENTVGRQIEVNRAICEEGLKNTYGARVGKILLAAYGEGVMNRAKAISAAGSDARMNGCDLPVIIISGSGNQGITACMPVVVYAEEMEVPRERLLRAVALSDLVTIHLKAGVGRLSAYCGAVCAGVGAGAGVCYLFGGDFEKIASTVANGLAIASGIVCDGAKSSCAAKIAAAVDAGLFGFEMERRGSCFAGGEGILEKGVERTIDNVGSLARNGMKETDAEIIRMMLRNINEAD